MLGVDWNALAKLYVQLSYWTAPLKLTTWSFFVEKTIIKKNEPLASSGGRLLCSALKKNTCIFNFEVVDGVALKVGQDEQMFSSVCTCWCVSCCFVPQNSELFITMCAVLQMDWLLHRPKQTPCPVSEMMILLVVNVTYRYHTFQRYAMTFSLL